MCGRTTTIETSAERRQHLSHVANEVVVDFGIVHHNQSSAIGLKRRSDVFRTESAEAITMFDHNRRHGWVSEQSEEFASLAVESGADFSYDAINRMTLRRGPSTHSRHLTIEVCSLVTRSDASVDGGNAVLQTQRFEIADENQATDLPRWHRQCPLSEPPIGGLGMYPCRSAHSLKFIASQSCVGV